jgi:hypothetical protein
MINIVEQNTNQKHIKKHVGVVDNKNHKRKELVDKNQEKKNSELLARKEDEMMTTRSIVS